MAELIYPASLPVPQASMVTPAERRHLASEDRPREARAIERDRRQFERLTWPPMTEEQSAAFRAWWKDELIFGGAWFAATWPLPRGFTVAVRKFKSQPFWTYIPGGFWRVTALCEVRGVGELPTTGAGIHEEKGTLATTFASMQYASVYQAAHPGVVALGGLWETSTAGFFVTFDNDDTLAQLSVSGAYAGEQSVAGTVVVNDGERFVVAWEFVVTDEIPTMLRAFALVPQGEFYGDEFLGGFMLDDTFGIGVTYYTYDGWTSQTSGNPPLTIGDRLGVVFDDNDLFVYFYVNGVLALVDENPYQTFENLVPVFTIGPYPVQFIGADLTATTEGGSAAGCAVTLRNNGTVEYLSTDGDPTYQDWVLRPSTPVDFSETARYKIRATLISGTITSGSALNVWLDGDSDPSWQVGVPGNELGETESGSIYIEIKLASNDAPLASGTVSMVSTSLPA